MALIKIKNLIEENFYLMLLCLIRRKKNKVVRINIQISIAKNTEIYLVSKIKILKKIANKGILSVNTIELEISNPYDGFFPIGNANYLVENIANLIVHC